MRRFQAFDVGSSSNIEGQIGTSGWPIGNCPRGHTTKTCGDIQKLLSAGARSKAVRAAIPVGHGTADKHRCWPLSNALLTSLEGEGFTFEMNYVMLKTRKSLTILR